MPARTKEPQSPLDPLSAAVGKRVVDLRTAREMTPGRLAELAGMDPNYLWRIEAGRQNLSVRNVARLAKAFDLTLAGFFQGVEIGDIELGSRPYSRRAEDEV